MKGKKVVIVGGGVIGLSIGWRLAQSGCEVKLFDDGGICASEAAAGMLGLCAELDGLNSDLLNFNRINAALWPNFRRELERVSGLDLDFSPTGTLVLRHQSDSSEIGSLFQRYEYLKSLDLPAEWLGRDAIRDREPLVDGKWVDGIYCGQDYSIDPRLMTEALKRAFQASGGELIEAQEVEAIAASPAGGFFLTVNGERVGAENVVIAAGWRSASLLKPFGVNCPIEAVKGEILSVETKEMLIRHVIRTDQVYLVPRRDRIVIGATVLPGLSDLSVDNAHIAKLISCAADVVPSIGHLNVLDVWAGVRPLMPDHLPVLDEISTLGLFVATGHYRNGIFWTPATAELISSMVLEKPLITDVEAFRALRFPECVKKQVEVEKY